MIQVYTGCGKGKTTAALGLAIRAAGAGKKVYIAQFAKGRAYSELKIIDRIRGIKLEQFGRVCFIRKKARPEDLALAKKGLEKIRQVIARGNYDLVILDEMNIALHLKLVKLPEVLSLIKNTPQRIELVLTGRYAPAAIIKLADLVSEIKERKHYYQRGIAGRRGIEF